MTFWAILLQWSRLGISAAIFLLAARLLPLTDIGIFATAFALPKLLQVIHKSGITELRITSDAPDRPIFSLSLLLGLTASLLCLATLPALPPEARPHAAALAILPLLNALSAVSEGHLRRALRIRTLALRTLTAQSVAALVTLIALTQDYGPWSLTLFALTNTALTTAISLTLAPPTLRQTAKIRPLILDLTRLTLRPLAGSATFPLVQLLIALTLGLPAAGAFQIATRLVELIDTLALAPLRYLALPRFKSLAHTQGFAAKLRQSLLQITLLTALIYPLAWLIAPYLFPLLGPDKSRAALPLLPPLLVTGALSALLMPLTQALTALGRTAPPLHRTVLTLVLTLALLTPVLHHPLAFWTLPLASALAALLFLRTAHRILAPTKASA